ncbi:nucleoside/nucleotide kinase family protein [Georgenia sp. Z1344]|uniref:nucleoside/nucleotide kinase family protein n=1 Tax=Georgenia sp. Z1344 TaxID=3416706 RepID=UPI003CF76AD1
MTDRLIELAAAIVERARSAESPTRPILGITGAPGAGKSTLAAALAAGLHDRGIRTALLPMDGFHLADVELDRLGRRDRKGAIDTFDGWGYLSALERAAAATDHVVYVPGFERDLEQPIAGAVPIDPAADLVITEGNYLLADAAPWDRLTSVLTETWFIDIADALRRDRLVARHVEFGKSPDDAAAWVRDVDEPNARAILARKHAADRVVQGG